jgi:segregation and condensation protein A
MSYGLRVTVPAAAPVPPGEGSAVPAQARPADSVAAGTPADPAAPATPTESAAAMPDAHGDATPSPETAPVGATADAAAPVGAAGDAAEPVGAAGDAAEPVGAAAEPVDVAADVAGQVGVAGDTATASTGFRVSLANFEGPFDLLLQLIGKHKLEITEVSLSKVTDEFIAYIRAMGDDWDLDEASEFLVVAATLLDLKAARLLPAAAVEDEEDLALLEARDLLFARLLQYKAFKEAAAYIAQLSETGNRRWPRAVGLEPRFAEALPDLVLGIGPARLAALAAKAMTPKQPQVVAIDHVHLVRVSVREHAAALREKLARMGTATFRYLCSDCGSTLEVVARFLALLELYREGMIAFDQMEALGELTVRWTGQDSASELEIDEYAGAPPEAGPSDAVAAPDVTVESAVDGERAASPQPAGGTAPPATAEPEEST